MDIIPDSELYKAMERNRYRPKDMEDIKCLICDRNIKRIKSDMNRRVAHASCYDAISKEEQLKC